MSTDQVIFLFKCIESNGIKFDFNAVGQSTGLKPSAARMRYTRLRKTIEQHLDNDTEIATSRPRRKIANYISTTKPATHSKRKLNIGSTSDSIREPPTKRQRHTKQSTPEKDTSDVEPIQKVDFAESTSHEISDHTSSRKSDETSSVSSAGAQLQAGLLLDIEGIFNDNISGGPVYPGDSVSEIIKWADLVEAEREW